MPHLRAARPAPTTRYRRGSRHWTARRAHTEQSRQWRRNLRAAELDADTRERLLQHIRRNGDVVTATQWVGTTHNAVYGFARWPQPFRDALEDALAEGCRAISHGNCGTAMGYKQGGRCAACRAAHR